LYLCNIDIVINLDKVINYQLAGIFPMLYYHYVKFQHNHMLIYSYFKVSDIFCYTASTTCRLLSSHRWQMHAVARYKPASIRHLLHYCAPVPIAHILCYKRSKIWWQLFVCILCSMTVCGRYYYKLLSQLSILIYTVISW